ncbi:MAG: hypothetical protein HUU01_10410 [Saprospiraceae bacterium]|nr:hypothetical protein [Saprospiraceae bacterium]
MKQLPDGRISLDITDIGKLLNEAVVARMIDEEGIIWQLLEEIRCKLIGSDGKRIKLRKSEFLCLVQPETMRNLDAHEQAYLMAVLLPKKLNRRKRKKSAAFLNATEPLN